VALVANRRADVRVRVRCRMKLILATTSTVVATTVFIRHGEAKKSPHFFVSGRGGSGCQPARRRGGTYNIRTVIGSFYAVTTNCYGRFHVLQNSL
jgi:hypothetical protein